MKQLYSSAIGAAAVIFLATGNAQAAVTQVIGVRLQPTKDGLDIIMDTATGNSRDAAAVLRPQVLTSTRSNSTIANIVNAQLHLNGGNSFRQANPAPGITSVTLNQVDPNTVQMVVTGTTKAPTNEIAVRDAKAITLHFKSPATVAQSPTSPLPPIPRGSPESPPASSASPAPPALSNQVIPSQNPNVMVPNPNITFSGQPASPNQVTDSGVPPLLPRAIAPPVGDIAVSNTDSAPNNIDLGTNVRVPRLVLRDAPAREVLTLLARQAGLNVVFIGATNTTPGATPQPGPNPTTSPEGPTVSLDIENETVQDVFNYILRISSLEANRTGNTILVGPSLPNEARNVIVRSFRLNQVQVGVALNYLVGFGAESAISRERVITSVSAVPVGGSPTPATQTQTSTETRVETQRINFQDAIPLLRGLQVIGDERTNSLTLVGSPRQVEIATTQLIQLDARRRQVAVNVKIVDVNLLATQDFNTSFSFGIGNNFFSVNNGTANVNTGGVTPPSSATVTGSVLSPPVTGAPLPSGTSAAPFLDRVPNAPFSNNNTPLAGGATIPRAPFGTLRNPLQPGVTNIPQSGPITFALPTLFQYPNRFLSALQAQVVNQNAKILTDPTLIVQEGQQANVNLTQEVVGNVSTQTNFASGVAIQTVNVTKENVGLTLSIRIERIDDNGFIALSVAPVVRAPQTQQTINLGGGNTQTIFLVSERSLNSGVIRLRDSQTLILSGIIQDQDTTTVSKVPILGDIPILGALFRSTDKRRTRQEVVVLITPQILDDSQRSTFGYNYSPSPEVRQILENRGLDYPQQPKKKK